MIAASPSSVVSVREVMTSPVLTTRTAATALEAVEIMHRHHVAHLVVVDEEERVKGVVSEADLRAAQPSSLLVPDPITRAKGLAMLRVQDVMTPHPWTARADWPLTRLLQVMRDTRASSIPVVDARGHAEGVVTGMDVVRLALRLLQEH